jgi:hypothetical protein
MNKILIPAALVAVLLSSCAGVKVVRPQVDQVKSAAFVSITTNVEIPSTEAVKEKEKKKESIFSALKKATSTPDLPTLLPQQQELESYTIKGLSDMLSSLSDIKVVPVESVLSNSEYQNVDDLNTGSELVDKMASNMAAQDNAAWGAPQGMKVISYDQVVPTSTNYSNGERTETRLLKKLGTLCGPLGVDAVAVAQLYLAYEPSTFTIIMNGDPADKGRGYATPVVLVNLVLINKDGEAVLKSDQGWDRFTGEKIPMLNDGKVDFGDAKGKTLSEFKSVIDAGVTAMKVKARKALSK